MKISNSLTTVTRLSKIIALILFILLPFIGFRLGFNYRNAIDVPENCDCPIAQTED